MFPQRTKISRTLCMSQEMPRNSWKKDFFRMHEFIKLISRRNLWKKWEIGKCADEKNSIPQKRIKERLEFLERLILVKCYGRIKLQN